MQVGQTIILPPQNVSQNAATPKIPNRIVICALAALSLLALAFLAYRFLGLHSSPRNNLPLLPVRASSGSSVEPQSSPELAASIHDQPAEVNPSSHPLLAGLIEPDFPAGSLVEKAQTFLQQVIGEWMEYEKRYGLINTAPQGYLLSDLDQGESTSNVFICVKVLMGCPINHYASIESMADDLWPHTHEVASCIGRRREMEDRHIATIVKTVFGDLCVVGVFDGHGGVECADFVQKKWNKYFVKELERLDPKSVDKKDAVIFALNNTIIKIDEITHRKEMLFVGTTATVSVILDRHIITANLGDSRAVLYKSNECVPLTFDANPDTEDPQRRFYVAVEKLGAIFDKNIYISTSESAGSIAVAASIGDHQFVDHRYGRKCLINVPEITIVEYAPGDRLLIACDGVWEKLHFQHPRMISSLKENSEFKDITDAALITREAISKGSKDNITTLVVNLFSRSAHAQAASSSSV